MSLTTSETTGTPHMVKQTVTFSDGTEKVINYTQNGEAEAIEAASAEMVEENKEPVIEALVEEPEPQPVPEADPNQIG